MTFKEKREKTAYLLELIRKRRLCSLSKIATQFHCSKRTIERMISALREEGYAIQYCRSKRKYILNAYLSEKD